MLHRAGNLEPVNMNLFSDIHTRVIEALDVLVRAGDLPEGLDFANVTVERCVTRCMVIWRRMRRWCW